MYSVQLTRSLHCLCCGWFSQEVFRLMFCQQSLWIETKHAQNAGKNTHNQSMSNHELSGMQTKQWQTWQTRQTWTWSWHVMVRWCRCCMVLQCRVSWSVDANCNDFLQRLQRLGLGCLGCLGRLGSAGRRFGGRGRCGRRRRRLSGRKCRTCRESVNVREVWINMDRQSLKSAKSATTCSVSHTIPVDFVMCSRFMILVPQSLRSPLPPFVTRHASEIAHQESAWDSVDRRKLRLLQIVWASPFSIPSQEHKGPKSFHAKNCFVTYKIGEPGNAYVRYCCTSKTAWWYQANASLAP